MHHALAHELRVLERRYEAEDALLLSPFEVGLEADDVEERPFGVVLPQLHDGIGSFARVRRLEADGAQRAEEQRLLAALRYHLDGQAAVEVAHLLFLEVVARRGLGVHELAPENFIFLFVHRAVDVVALVAIAVGLEGLRHVDGRNVYYRRDCVVEVEKFLAGQRGELLRHRRARQRPGRDDRGLFGKLRKLLAHQLDVRVVRNFLVYRRSEAFAVHCERVARGNARAFGAFHYEAAHARELGLQDASGGRRLFAAERVAAYELAEHPRLMRGRHLVRAHLIEAHLHAAARELPRRLGA